jgi:hypothetical protein
MQAVLAHYPDLAVAVAKADEVLTEETEPPRPSVCI